MYEVIVYHKNLFPGTFERSGITLMADSQYNGQTRVQVLLDYIQERQMDIEDLGAIRRIKLEQCVQLCQFESDANQVHTYSSINMYFQINVVSCLNPHFFVNSHPLHSY